MNRKGIYRSLELTETFSLNCVDFHGHSGVTSDRPGSVSQTSESNQRSDELPCREITFVNYAACAKVSCSSNDGDRLTKNIEKKCALNRDDSRSMGYGKGSCTDVSRCIDLPSIPCPLHCYCGMSADMCECRRSFSDCTLTDGSLSQSCQMSVLAGSESACENNEDVKWVPRKIMIQSAANVKMTMDYKTSVANDDWFPLTPKWEKQEQKLNDFIDHFYRHNFKRSTLPFKIYRLASTSWLCGIWGVFLIIVGAVLLAFSLGKTEVEFPYDRSTETKRWFRVDISESWEPPIYIYYRIKNFYGNYRPYLKDGPPQVSSSYDCDVVRTQESAIAARTVNGVLTLPNLQRNVLTGAPISNQTPEIFPCGAQSVAFFNDNIIAGISHSGGNTDSGSHMEILPLNMEDIVYYWDFLQYAVPKRAWEHHGLQPWILPQSPEFRVWLHPPFTPHFQKLYAVINRRLNAGDSFYLQLTDNLWPAETWNAEKAFVVGISTPIGGSNMYLSIATLVAGGLCVIGVIFLWILRSCNYLRRSQTLTECGWDYDDEYPDDARRKSQALEDVDKAVAAAREPPADAKGTKTLSGARLDRDSSKVKLQDSYDECKENWVFASGVPTSERIDKAIRQASLPKTEQSFASKTVDNIDRLHKRLRSRQRTAPTSARRQGDAACEANHIAPEDERASAGIDGRLSKRYMYVEAPPPNQWSCHVISKYGFKKS